MKKILMRSGISPFDNFDATEIISRNLIGGNVGNLIYAYTVYRTLTTEDTKVVPDYYSRSASEERVEEINEKYDAYVIPLADAFRKDFAHALRDYTKLIKQLKIPVYVIGAGLRAPFEPNLDEGFPFDEDVKAFISAVLEKSEMVGLRGQITADYLTRLGFKEGRDHVVIGCPSMYAFGRDLSIKNPQIDENSTVSVNSSLLSPKIVLDFIHKSMNQFKNYYFIPQWYKELILTYTGLPELGRDEDNYPTKMSDAAYMEDRVRYFLNVPTWIEFMKNVDLSFGARLHGNITATIAGTPSIIIPKDARMRELAEYHNLTRYWWNDLTDETNIFDLVEQLDFQAPTKVQAENFDNFITFLNKNGIDHIYKETNYPKRVPLDEQIKTIDYEKPVSPISSCTLEETVQRLEKSYPVIQSRNKRIENRRIRNTSRKLNRQINILEKENKDLKRKNKDSNKKNKDLKGTINRKSARFALKFANMFRRKK